jgi:hypothetical protein
MVDDSHPVIHGAAPREEIDFGLLSFALQPFSDSDNSVVIYAAGCHGPATSHSLELLADRTSLQDHPLGGVFEVQMSTFSPFSSRFQDVTKVWDTTPYSMARLGDFSLRHVIEARKRSRIPSRAAVFISAPLRHSDTAAREKTEWIAGQIEAHYARQGFEAKCYHTYNIQSIGTWNYVHGIIKHFPPCDFILHDLTEFSPGVVFEIGCSMGLNKRFVLLWDIGAKAFEAAKLASLLRFTDVRQIDFSQREQARSSLEAILAEIPVGPGKTGSQCPGFAHRTSQSPCPYQHSEGNSTAKSDHVFIVVSSAMDEVRNSLIEKVRRKKRAIVLPSDEPVRDDCSICSICKGIATCGNVIVDVTNSDMDGLLALGMARARERHTLQLLRDGSVRSSMFDGRTAQWRRETLDSDLETALASFLDGG